MKQGKTICALATPPGIAGLAVIRVSGERAIESVDKIFSGRHKLTEAASHTINYGKIFSSGKLLDTVTASVFRSPNSYTGEDVVEIGCHGGNFVAQSIISTLIGEGMQLAAPGEFTQRAFLNGKLDLMQVEAVADLIHASSLQGAQTAARQLAGGFTNKISSLRRDLIDLCALLELELDFSEEDVEFVDRMNLFNKIDTTINFCSDLANKFSSSEILRSGYYVGIVGFPNAGKSSLFNALLDRRRAIVSDVAGTTRDYLEEVFFLGELTVRLFDTAGIRSTENAIELEGISLAQSIIEQCNLVLVLNDANAGFMHSLHLLEGMVERFPHLPFAYVNNKVDLLSEKKFSDIIVVKNSSFPVISISAKSGEGIPSLKNFLAYKARESTEVMQDVLINQRHAMLLREIISCMESARNSLQNGMTSEFVALDVRNAIAKLGELTGEQWSEDVLNAIFSRFCIGK